MHVFRLCVCVCACVLGWVVATFATLVLHRKMSECTKCPCQWIVARSLVWVSALLHVQGSELPLDLVVGDVGVFGRRGAGEALPCGGRFGHLS